MGIFNLNKKESNTQKAGTISRLLDDLTTLEINTIIKSGMTAAPQPDSIEETLELLLNKYTERMVIIMSNNNIGSDSGFDFSACHTVKVFHNKLIEFKGYMDKQDIRLYEFDFIRILRMISFGYYICSRSKSQNEDQKTKDYIEVKPLKKEVDVSEDVCDLDLRDLSTFRLIMNVRDRVKIKRLFDLGTENVVMQTRFGIDGDVVTRIEENFASKPKQLVIDIHDKHTDLTVNYWKSLIGIVQDLVGKIFN